MLNGEQYQVETVYCRNVIIGEDVKMRTVSAGCWLVSRSTGQLQQRCRICV